MTHKHLADSHLDAEIDRAVREMMNVEPRADLRARVVAEILDQPARAIWWPRLALGSAALAAAALILLVFVNRPPDQPVDQTNARTQPATAPGSPGEATGPATETAPKVVARGPAIVDRAKPRTVAPRPAIEDRPVQAASIDTTELIVIEPLAPVERLKPIEPIALSPLALAPIEFTPLRPPR
jgi:hypothetical protein